jgi:hypothetical protein
VPGEVLLSPRADRTRLPTTIRQLFAAAALQPAGAVRWGDRVSEAKKGVYVVALTASADEFDLTLRTAPIAPAALDRLLKVRPELRIDGGRPTPDQLRARVASFWVSDEIALYIGRAGLKDRDRSLSTRVGEYYRTPLGARRPHSGGWFLKLLRNLDELYVFYSPASDPEEAEGAMIRRYVQHLSEATLLTIRDPAHPFPFANLEYPKRVYKAHGVTGARGDVT